MLAAGGLKTEEGKEGGGEIAHTCLVLGEDISRNDWNSLQSSHRFGSGDFKS